MSAAAGRRPPWLRDGADVAQRTDLAVAVAGLVQHLVAVLPDGGGVPGHGLGGLADRERAVHRAETPVREPHDDVAGRELLVVQQVFRPGHDVEHDAVGPEHVTPLIPVPRREDLVQHGDQLDGPRVPIGPRGEARVRRQVLPVEAGGEDGPVALLVENRQDEPPIVAAAVVGGEGVERLLAGRSRHRDGPDECGLRQVGVDHSPLASSDEET